MAIYRGVGGASSTTSAANVEEVLEASVQAVDAAAAASVSETNAAASAAAAANTYDDFDDRYLGAKTSDPATDNDGDALEVGALYFSTTEQLMKVYDGGVWTDLGNSASSVSEVETLTSGQTVVTFTNPTYISTFYIRGADADNGRLLEGTDYTNNTGSRTVTLAQSYPAGTQLVMVYRDFNEDVDSSSNSVTAINVEKQVAAGGETSFTLASISYIMGVNSLFVYRDGTKLRSGVDYTETSTTTITLDGSMTVAADEAWEFVAFERSVGGDVVSASNVTYTTGGSTTNAQDHLAATDYIVGTHTTAINTINTKLADIVSVKDFGAVGDGVTDDTTAIQAAIDTKLAVHFPAGDYLLSSSLKPWSGQKIYSDYTPQHGTQAADSAVILKCPVGISGFDTATNTAIGVHIEGFTLLGASANGDGTVGVKLGTEGTTGATSTNIRTVISKVLCIGFDIGFGVYGFSWEVELNSCHAHYARTYGYDFDDSATIVTMNCCSAQNTGLTFTNWQSVTPSSNVSSTGVNVQSTGDIQILMNSPRFENNQGRGLTLDGNAKVTINSIYCEGNRVSDCLLPSTFEGNLSVVGGRFLHNNDGVTTDAVVQDLSTQHRTVSIDSCEYVVGTTSTNLISYGLYGRVSPTGLVTMTNMKIEGDIGTLSSGNREIVYLKQSGYYAPDLFTISQLPNVIFKRSINWHVGEVISDSVASLPTALNVSDGSTTYDMLAGNMWAHTVGEIHRYNFGTSAWVKISV